MADCILFNELEESMVKLKIKGAFGIINPKLASTYAKVIEGFIPFCQRNVGDYLSLSEILEQYYEHVTKQNRSANRIQYF